MSTLLVTDFITDEVVEMPFKITRTYNISHIRPWIYKEGVLENGTFELYIYDGETLLGGSSIATSDINSVISDTYAHGFVRFDFESLLLHVPERELEKEYTIKFIYTAPQTTSSLSIVRRWQAKIYDTYGTGVIDNEAPNDTLEPYGIEFYEYTTR